MNTFVEIAEIVFNEKCPSAWVESSITLDSQYELLNECKKWEGPVNKHGDLDTTVYGILLFAAENGEL